MNGVPAVGDRFRLFGKEWEAIIVEPWGDWTWHIVAERYVDGERFAMTLKVDSEERTV